METKNDQGRRRGQQEAFNQSEDEEAEREEKEGEEEKERKMSEKELMATEGEEEEQAKPKSRLEVKEAHEVQMEDNKFENNKETVAEKQKSKETKCLQQKNENKKSRRRRGKKQNEKVKNRRGAKDFSERAEEETIQMQEVSVNSDESSALSEAPLALVNSSDLSDPIYLGCGATGMYCPTVPIPLLYSSQPPIPIQPAPPHPQGTKRPHSPLLPHSLPQQGAQPLEVRTPSPYLFICEHQWTKVYLFPETPQTHTLYFYLNKYLNEIWI